MVPLAVSFDSVALAPVAPHRRHIHDRADPRVRGDRRAHLHQRLTARL